MTKVKILPVLGKCEVCGKDATVQVTDQRELAPERVAGKLRPRFEGAGVHLFCPEHYRPCRIEWWDGHSIPGKG